MNDPNYGSGQSITFYAAADREHQAASERALTAWAIVALVLVVCVLMLGGCA